MIDLDSELAGEYLETSRDRLAAMEADIAFAWPMLHRLNELLIGQAVTCMDKEIVAVEAVDFRNGIDGLARVCQEQLQADPFSGRLFVFRNRRRTALKILAYDGRGFWLCQKRLSRGRFGFWPVSLTGVTKALEAHEFYVLLAGGVSIARQALDAGLADEIVLHVVPRLAGRGMRLFGAARADLRCTEAIQGEGAVHLRYEIR